MKAYADPTHPGNSEKYLTGKPCLSCGKPAGTAWGPLWCFSCHKVRIDRIDQALNDLVKIYKTQR
jgi:DNA-directed RNA polymerase subunit N (RpoN/RPB10)